MSLDEEEHPLETAERREAEQRIAEARRPAQPASPPPEVEAPRPPQRRHRRLLFALLALVVLGAIGGGIDWWLGARHWVSTDDAFIDTHTVRVSPQVAGRVKSVPVEDNEVVKAGQLLVQLDPADFQAKLNQALASQQSAAGQQAQATAQLPVARANFDAAEAQVAASEAANTNAAQELQRDVALQRYGSLAITGQKVDADTATARTDAANLAAAKQKAVAAKAQIALDQKNVETAAANVSAAAAQVAQARLSLSYTMIRAPEAGRIANKNVAPGDYVTTGQALMALVPDRVWVTANFKETEIGRMRVGDPVDIYVDAYPGRVFHGRVQSVQAGSGAAFSLLPPENATGNYVKVVQRVPVKITFDDHPAARWLLGPGMSVEPYVKVR